MLGPTPNTILRSLARPPNSEGNVGQVGLAFCSPVPSPDTPAIDVPLTRTRGTQQTVRT